MQNIVDFARDSLRQMSAGTPNEAQLITHAANLVAEITAEVSAEAASEAASEAAAEATAEAATVRSGKP
jgi:hypothetical protein